MIASTYLSPSTTSVLVRLGADVFCALVLAYLLYRRRYRRPELAFVYVAFNIGVFAALSVISGGRITVAIGFGIFGILSIIRLRSETFDNVEIGYFFLALVLALVNGLGGKPWVVALLDAVLLCTVLLGDLDRERNRVRSQRITLDRVLPDETTLARHLEELLGGEILAVTPTSSDFVKDVSVVDVHYRRPHGDDG